MKIKQALDILKLPSGAYLEDAKASFRTLAKKYHPDKLNINHEQPLGQEKMKEINLAFHILKKTLKPKETPKPKQSRPLKTTSQKQPFLFKDLGTLFKKVYTKLNRPTSKKAKLKQTKPYKDINNNTEQKNYVRKNPAFDSVLNKTIKNSSKKDSRKTCLKSTIKIKSKSPYSQYVQLKQKMTLKKKSPVGDYTIEKISPISPIKKV